MSPDDDEALTWSRRPPSSVQRRPARSRRSARPASFVLDTPELRWVVIRKVMEKIAWS
ncbi:MAG: hypothetical protein U0235_12280 [Polyangiaceae bacterium]